MIDVSEVIVDPDVAQAYTVYRKTGKWDAGRWVSDPEQALSFFGPVTVAGPKDIQAVPEGDRQRGAMNFYSLSEAPIYITRATGEAGISDEVLWRGHRYRIYQSLPEADYGYWKATGTQISAAG